MNIVCTIKQPRMLRSRITERTSQRIFFGVPALLFVVSAALTIRWCTGMSMDEMPMPGGWTMSMTWMRMYGQTWIDAAASFLSMWVVMMIAMMLPSVTPTLWRYYRIVSQANDKAEELRAVRLTLIVSLGYFFVWTMIGMAAFPIGVALTTIEMHSPTLARVVPLAASIVVLLAGVLQFTAWKAHHLACCRVALPCQVHSANSISAWLYGMHLGVHCNLCCAGLTAVLLVVGVMDLRAMVAVAIAITVERLASTASAARIVGVAVVTVGLLMIARAVSLMHHSFL